MKKFNEIKNFGTIRCQAKVGTEQLKELHHEANEIIFKYNMQFAFPKNVERTISLLTELFIKIKELEVKGAAQDKQQELLQTGREIIKSLKGYLKNFKYDNSCIEAIEHMCKFQLSKYLKAKDTLTISEGLQLLESNIILRDIANDIEVNLNAQPNIKPFIRMQDEIIEAVSKQLHAYSFK